LERLLFKRSKLACRALCLDSLLFVVAFEEALIEEEAAEPALKEEEVIKEDETEKTEFSVKGENSASTSM
jgi:hypothetical protein